ncbi:multicopper oxidase domain-containing protein [uncultured Cellulomonas sp.]|uniref:multicopper oxidase domain-containing protein n=1 Tax=uncultured Cellulomonas sp. TaxID=189682 RepID=UPI002621892E|nr:multicopper oxidase domain-containing protein [uncultured Cellulomonas sp.]
MRSRWHVRANSLVVGWLLVAAVLAGAHRAVPQAQWLMVHALLLGAVSTAILIWSAHFAEALRRRPLPGGHRGQAVRLAGHTIGAVGVIAGLVTGMWPVVVAGATAVAGVAAVHLGVLLAQNRQPIATGLGWTTWYFVAATATLPVGAALGAVLARPDLAGDAAARAYVAHVVVMLLGWVGLTVVGTLATLWPTMLRVQVDAAAQRAARHALALLGGALVAALIGAATGARPVTATGLFLYAAGIAWAVRPLVVQARHRPPAAFAPWSVGFAMLWLLGAVLTWAWGIGSAVDWPAAQASFGPVLAPLAVGFAAQVLLGALCHLGPMVLGGGPAAVRTAIALVDRGATARVVLTNGGLLLFVLPAPSLVRVGVSVVVLAALAATPVLLVRAAVASRRAARRAAQPGAPTGPVAVAAAELLVPPRRRRLGPGVVGAATLALVVAVGVAADPAAAGWGSSADNGVAPTGRVVEVAVEAGDMRFTPDAVRVDAGDRLVLVVTNTDDAVHDLVLDSGVSSGRLAAGATTRVDVGTVGRSLDGWCSVAGHRQMGMVLRVVVDGGAGGERPDTAGDPAADEIDDAHHGQAHADEGSLARPAPSAREDLDLRGEPGPGSAPYDPVLAPASPGTTHRVTLAVQEVQREVAPGVRQTLWTYGGTAPGPTLRGAVGDTFEITLVNDGSIGHSIDFHAGALAPDEPMRTIEPGESLTYTFTATRSGIWMYHCSTAPLSLHIANGMFGAVVIDPPDLPAVDREYLLVQSELYLGPQGGIADADAISAERPDAVAFNGYPGQYDHAPLTARVGERVRLWVLDAGPNRPSAFHVVGGQFDTVYLEGAYQLGGPTAARGAEAAGTGTGGAQVLGLLPAQGGFAELTFSEAGTYPFVSHLMVDAERGAHGLVEVRDASP